MMGYRMTRWVMHVGSRTEGKGLGANLSGKTATSRFLVAEKTEKGARAGRAGDFEMVLRGHFNNERASHGFLLNCLSEAFPSFSRSSLCRGRQASLQRD